MPGFNQRGPAGQGPMTGRRMGRCTNFGANQKTQTTEEMLQDQEIGRQDFGRGLGFGRRATGRGLGRGPGRGRGQNRGFGFQNRFRDNF